MISKEADDRVWKEAGQVPQEVEPYQKWQWPDMTKEQIWSPQHIPIEATINRTGMRLSQVSNVSQFLPWRIAGQKENHIYNSIFGIDRVLPKLGI